MPRNSGGSYSLPAGNPVSTGTTISSTWANNTLSDLATETTNSLDRGGRGAMTAALQLSDGSVSAPGLTFGSDTDSGLYRAGANDVRLAVGGADAIKATASGVNTTGTLTTSGALTVTSGGATVTAGNVTVSAGSLTVAGGDCTIDGSKSYKYASGATHIIHLAPCDFTNVSNYAMAGSLGILGVNSTNAAAAAAAQMRLPPGAIITGIDLCAANTDGSNKTWNVIAAKYTKSSTDYNAAAYFTTGTSGGVNITVNSGGAKTWQSVALVGGVATIDDSSADGYNIITVTLPSTTSSGQSQLVGVRITYTMTSVKPAV